MQHGWSPGIAAFYRGKDNHSAALQLKLISATASQEGTVRLEMTSGPAPFEYDWKKKIVWSFTLAELAGIIRLINFPSAEIPPVVYKHDPKAKQEGEGERTKVLKIKRGPRGGAFWDLSETFAKTPQNDRAHSFAMNDEELLIVRELFKTAIPIVIGWSSELCTRLPAPLKQPA